MTDQRTTGRADRRTTGLPDYRIPVLALRMVRERTLTLPRERMTGPWDARAVAQALIGKMPQEHLIAILTDASGTITGVARLGQGGMHGAGVHAADVLRAVLAHHACAFVLAHNHPSGEPEASEDDKRFTESIKVAARAVGLTFHEHIIVTRDPGKHSLHGGEA